jgi:hypothetical protein
MTFLAPPAIDFSQGGSFLDAMLGQIQFTSWAKSQTVHKFLAPGSSQKKWPSVEKGHSIYEA